MYLYIMHSLSLSRTMAHSLSPFLCLFILLRISSWLSFSIFMTILHSQYLRLLAFYASSLLNIIKFCSNDLSHVLQSQQRKAFKSVCNLSPHSHNLLIPQTENISNISNMLLIGCEIGHIRMLQVFAFNRKSNKPNKKYLFRKIYLYIPTSKECKRTRRTRWIRRRCHW